MQMLLSMGLKYFWIYRKSHMGKGATLSEFILSNDMSQIIKIQNYYCKLYFEKIFEIVF